MNSRATLRRTGQTALEAAPVYVAGVVLCIAILGFGRWALDGSAMSIGTALDSTVGVVAITLPPYLVLIGILHSVVAINKDTGSE
ncbi:hypothetical protein ACLI4Q_15175 [Natrialbaceae archaeon A-CW1-1]